MPFAFRRLAGTSAAVLGSFAVVVPLLSGMPASAVAADPAPVAAGAASSAAPLPTMTAAAAAGAATLVAPADAEPVTPEVEEVPVPDAERPSDPQLAAVSDPESVHGFGVVGVTWQGDEPRALGLQVRTKDDGAWSGWQELPYDEDHAPDPGTAEAAAAATRPGTDALVVGEVDAVQVRATSGSGEAPRDLELSVVDPGESPADDDPATLATTVEPAAPGTATVARPALLSGTADAALATQVATNPPGVRAPRPRIRSRAAWGANENLRSGSPSYGRVKAGFVHHTVNANRYSRSDVPAILRGIYAYHTQSNNWSDIGYNFLVDRFGRIWEGRYGGVTRNPIGAHTYGYNHVSFAMSAIGNFETGRPSNEMVRAYGRLMAWKLGLNGVPAGDRRVWMEGDRFKAINGHRDAGQTACPGIKLYRRIDDIRRIAVRKQQGGDTTSGGGDNTGDNTGGDNTGDNNTGGDNTGDNNTGGGDSGTDSGTRQERPDTAGILRDLQADGFPDLLARDAQTAQLDVLTGDGGPGFRARQVADEKIGGDQIFTGVGDVTGDGRPDLLVRNGRTKVSKIRPGRRGGRFGRAIAPTDRFAGADQIAGVGQMVGNRRPDLIARDARSGRVWLYTGRSNGRWGRKHLLIRRADDLTLLRGAGDVNRDGRADVLARDGGQLLLYPGIGRGNISSPVVIARGWRGKDLAAAGDDVTGDGRPDLVARDRDSRRTWIYVTNDNGRVVGRFGGWRTWRDLDRLSGVGDVTRDGKDDVVGRTRGGKLVVFPSKGTRWLQGPNATGRRAPRADFAQVAGDWNGDGHVDVVTRTGGTVRLYRGTGGDGLLEPSVLTKGWRDRTFLVAPGDLTGDGHPELLSRLDDGRVVAIRSNGRLGRDGRYVARERMFRTDLVAAAGYWNDDRTPDLVVRKRRGDDLYIVPGKADGTLGRPVPLAGGGSFGGYDRIVGVGYFTGDRYPDILAREKNKGRLWLFAGSANGLQGREFVASGMSRFDLLG